MRAASKAELMALKRNVIRQAAQVRPRQVAQRRRTGICATRTRSAPEAAGVHKERDAASSPRCRWAQSAAALSHFQL